MMLQTKNIKALGQDGFSCCSLMNLCKTCDPSGWARNTMNMVGRGYIYQISRLHAKKIFSISLCKTCDP